MIENARRWMQTRWGRRILVGVGIVTVGVIIGVAGCTSEGESQGEEINGMTPAKAVLQYRLAELQHDGKTLQKLTTGEEAKALAYFYPPNQGPQNQKSLPEEYELTEYEESDDVYLYHLFRSSTDYNAFYEVRKTEEGWKVDDLSKPKFERRIENLDPHIVKEANQPYGGDLLEN